MKKNILFFIAVSVSMTTMSTAIAENKETGDKSTFSVADVVFFDGFAKGISYGNSWVSVTPPAVFTHIKHFVPLSTAVKMPSGQSSLQLSWQISEGGWAVKVAADSHWLAKDITAKTHLKIVIHSHKNLNKWSLPYVILLNGSQQYSKKVHLGEYIKGDLPIGWTEILVPLPAFVNMPTGRVDVIEFGSWEKSDTVIKLNIGYLGFTTQ